MGPIWVPHGQPLYSIWVPHGHPRYFHFGQILHFLARSICIYFNFKFAGLLINNHLSETSETNMRNSLSWNVTAGAWFLYFHFNICLCFNSFFFLEQRDTVLWRKRLYYNIILKRKQNTLCFNTKTLLSNLLYGSYKGMHIIRIRNKSKFNLNVNRDH